MYIVILCPQSIWKHFWSKILLNTYIVVFKHECLSGCRAVYLDSCVESYTSTAVPPRFLVTLNLLPEFPPKSAQQQVVGAASVAFPLSAIQQQGSTVVTAGQESSIAKPRAQGCGPCRRLLWCCHGLAPLQWVALSHLAYLGDSL